jgi:hypothetical protein
MGQAMFKYKPLPKKVEYSSKKMNFKSFTKLLIFSFLFNCVNWL